MHENQYLAVSLGKPPRDERHDDARNSRNVGYPKQRRERVKDRPSSQKTDDTREQKYADKNRFR